MKYRNNPQKRWMPTAKMMACMKLADGRFTRGETSVIVERELPIYVNGRHLVTASITPVMEREFVTGYLFGQGFINSLEEVDSVEITDERAQVQLKDPEKIIKKTAGASYRIVSGGGRLAYSGEADLPVMHNHRKFTRQLIFKAINILFETARMYRETEGVHAAGLFTADGSLICIVEDIGRHNTLDKAIGYALINRVDCANTFLVSTGRMASEMVAKICRAGIPLAATKTAVTDKGLEIAQKQGLTLIGFVRDAGTRIHTDMAVRVIDTAGMKIYSGAERVPCEEATSSNAREKHER
jgi:FdhD protein